MTLGKKIEIFILAVLLCCGFLARLYRFDGPVADWHSWRQADTSAVSRNFVNNGINLLYPKFDDLSNVPSGIYDNPEGYRFVEFPLYNFFHAALYNLVGVFTLEEWGRLVSIFSSLCSAVFLYLIFSYGKQNILGIVSAFFYLFIPYNIFYSRAILPDSMMIMAVTGATYFFQLWLGEKSKQVIYFVISLLFMISALLLKPYALFFVLPIVYLAYEKFGNSVFKNWRLWFYALVSLLPLLFWRLWIQNFPAGIPASGWLLNGNGIRFRPSFFRWIFYERLTALISGYFGVIILISGILNLKQYKDRLFIATFGVSSLLYVTVFATGNVQHDYYQILIMPTVSIFFALGAIFLYRYKYKSLEVGKAILVLSLISLFVLGWNQVKDYFNINNPSIIAACAAVDRLTPKDAKIIAIYNGDTTFLYQTKRKGWASFEKSIPEMVKMGADYLVLANPTPVDLGLGNTYQIIEKTSQYVIFKLE